MNQAMLLSRNVRTFYPPSLGPYQNWDWPALFDAVLSVLRTPADRNAWAAAIETVKGFAPQMVVSEPVLAAAWRRFVLLYPMHPQDYALYYMRILLAWAGRYTEARRDPRTSDQVEQEWQSLEVQQQTQEQILLQRQAEAGPGFFGGDLGRVLSPEREARIAKHAATVSNLATAALSAALARLGISGPTVLSIGQYTKLSTAIIPQEIKRLAKLLPSAQLINVSSNGSILHRGRTARRYIERDARTEALAQLRASGYPTVGQRGTQPKLVRSCAAKSVIGALRGRRMPLSNFERKRVGSRYVNTGAPLRILTPGQYNELVSASLKRVRVNCRQLKQTALQWNMAVVSELKSRNYLPTAEQTRQARQVKPPVAPVTVAKPKKAPSPWMQRKMEEAKLREEQRSRQAAARPPRPELPPAAPRPQAAPLPRPVLRPSPRRRLGVPAPSPPPRPALPGPPPPPPRY